MRPLLAAFFAFLPLDAFAADAEVPPEAQALRNALAPVCGEGPQFSTVWSVQPPTRKDYTPRPTTLVRFSCESFAYNASQVWISIDEYGGATVLSFPEPRIDYAYQDADATKFKTAVLRGYAATISPLGTDYDPDTGTITGRYLWRGLGDAHQTTKWRYDGVDLLLDTFSVDPTFDGDETVSTLIENGRWVGTP